MMTYIYQLKGVQWWHH